MTEPTKRQRTKRSYQSAVRADVINAAFEVYNATANSLGFASVAARSPQRIATLGRRLVEIGAGDAEIGLDQFRNALAAIPHWPFLAGRVKPRDGRAAFTLDLERLLSTRSDGMGDVLARLLDLHAEKGPASNRGSGKGDKQFADAWAEARAEETAKQRARWDPPTGDADALR